MDIKSKRKELGMTQSDVAKAVGLSLTGYQLIERGVTRNPSVETIEKIKLLLQIDDLCTVDM